MVVLRANIARSGTKLSSVMLLMSCSASSGGCEVPECCGGAQLLSCRVRLLMSLHDMLNEGWMIFFLLILYLICYQCYVLPSIKISLQIYIFQSYGPWFHYGIFGDSLKYRKKLQLNVFHSVWVFLGGRQNQMSLFNLIVSWLRTICLLWSFTDFMQGLKYEENFQKICQVAQVFLLCDIRCRWTSEFTQVIGIFKKSMQWGLILSGKL